MLHFEAKDWDCNVTLWSMLEGRGWWLQCGAMNCIGRQRMVVAMWRYELHWKAKDGDCNVAL